jgi:hypothetical protein
MTQARQKKRFTVSDIGYGFAVHDTQAPYQRLTGEERGSLPDSSNALTSRILEIFPTREAAWRHARELNRAIEQRR